ncbi:MAG: hypothetical protein AAB353_11995 [Candidatus Hydrogenedentota bacterium]
MRHITPYTKRAPMKAQLGETLFGKPIISAETQSVLNLMSLLVFRFTTIFDIFL